MFDTKRIYRARADLDTELRNIQRAMGQPLPSEPFPALITGHVFPKVTTGDPPAGTRPWPNSPYVAANPCTDPAGLDDCTATSPEDVELPCGIYPTRYKWEAESVGLGGEGCGFRLNASGAWVRWKQFFYAINTAHFTQDHDIDYEFIRIGTPVIMAFGHVGRLTNDKPKYGFFFHHMTDPQGSNTCFDDSFLCGCCEIWQNVEEIGDPDAPTCKFCDNEDSCRGVYGTWVKSWTGPAPPGILGPIPCNCADNPVGGNCLIEWAERCDDDTYSDDCRAYDFYRDGLCPVL